MSQVTSPGTAAPELSRLKICRRTHCDILSTKCKIVNNRKIWNLYDISHNPIASRSDWVRSEISEETCTHALGPQDSAVTGASRSQSLLGNFRGSRAGSECPYNFFFAPEIWNKIGNITKFGDNMYFSINYWFTASETQFWAFWGRSRGIGYVCLTL